MVKMFEADSREQLMALHPSDIYLDPTQRSTASDAIVSEGFVEEDMELKSLKGRPFWCRTTSVKRADENGQTYFDGAIVDITERLRGEEELRGRVEELARANADLERFAYVASHDLQEPLRMISSYLQLIEQRYADKLDADGLEFMGFAVGGAKRLQSMITALLQFSRAGDQSTPFVAVDCDEVLTAVQENLKTSIDDAGASVTFDHLPEITANALLLIQLFQNLITNAIKFRGEEPVRIHVSARHAAGEWVFAVRDNGLGIDAEYHERIFVVFQRLWGPEYPGTGVGLSICKRIVEGLKGRIWVESQLGKGTTFYFTIPD